MDIVYNYYFGSGHNINYNTLKENGLWSNSYPANRVYNMEELKKIIQLGGNYVQSIFEGKKKFEYRKIVAKNKPTKIVIYSTYPVSAVVGEAEVEEILIDSPDNLWKKTKKKSGVDKNFFFKYFKEKKVGVAYQLKNIVEYDEIRSLEEFGVKCAPQSYVYL